MPGSERAWLGFASISPGEPVVAGELGRWAITYTVGVSGIDEGGRIRVATRMVSDWAVPQFDDPCAENFVAAQTDADVRLNLAYAVNGIRPWNKTLTVQIADGTLGCGDVVTIMLGGLFPDSPGMRAQTFPEHPFRFKVQVDPFATGIYELVGEVELDIVGGPASQLVLVAPSDVVLGEESWLQIRALDRWGNPDPEYLGTITFDGDVPDGLPRTVDLTPEDRGVRRFDDVRFSMSGILRLSVSDAHRNLVAESNPIRSSTESPTQRLYWGDLHGQTNETVGTGTMEQYFAYGRDIAAVDAVGHQGNDFQITKDVYDSLREHVNRFYEPGRFVTFLGYEWSGNTKAGGDRNVYFLQDGAIHRSSHTEVDDHADIDTDRYPLDRLHETFAGRDDVLMVPHIGGRPAGLHYHDPALEPVIEIASQWGRFEWFAHDALSRGYQVGFIGGSDDHSGRPGWSAPTLAHHGVQGGLTGFFASSLTREGLWESLQARRCYGTSGPRIILDVDVSGHPMGAEAVEAGLPLVQCRVVGTAPIDTIEIRRGTTIIHRAIVRPLPADTDSWRIRIAWRGARNRGRSRALDWSGNFLLSGGAIVNAQGFAIDSPLDGIIRWDDRSISWSSHTVGDWDGVILDIDGDDDTTAAVTAGDLTFSMSLSDLRSGEIVHTGPYLEQQLVVQRLALEDGPCEAAVRWVDEAPNQGVNPYWIWVTQMDGETAWSSPVYLHVAHDE